MNLMQIQWIYKLENITWEIGPARVLSLKRQAMNTQLEVIKRHRLCRNYAKGDIVTMYHLMARILFLC